MKYVHERKRENKNENCGRVLNIKEKKNVLVRKYIPKPPYFYKNKLKKKRYLYELFMYNAKYV